MTDQENLLEGEAVSLPPPFSHYAYATVGSTQDIARAYAEKHGMENFVVTAKQQQTGRGRQGRIWTSPEGNLYATLMLCPKRPMHEWGQLAYVFGLSLAAALEEVGVPKVHLKWPNDILIEDAKCCGILIETVEMASGGRGVLVGTGINLLFSPENTPYPATSVKKVTRKEILPFQFLPAYIKSVQKFIFEWEQNGFVNLREEWLSKAWRLGEAIGYKSEKTSQETVLFHGIDAQGCLLLEDHEGHIKRILTGDVIFPEA